MSTSPAPTTDLAHGPFAAQPRGVWRMKFTSASGRPLVAMVAADGRRLQEREILPSESRAEVEGEMWNELDSADPVASVES